MAKRLAYYSLTMGSRFDAPAGALIVDQVTKKNQRRQLMPVQKNSIAASAVVTGLSLILALFHPARADGQLSYSYVELVGDFSRTDNTARGAVSNASGRFYSVTGSFGFAESFYVRVAASKEDKNFTNDVFGFGVQTDLDTAQRFAEAGAGFHIGINPVTDVYAELIGMDSKVEHDLPCINSDSDCHKLLSPEAGRILGELRGSGRDARPPEVSTIVGVLAGRGLGGKLGIRSKLSDGFELESSLRVNQIIDETDYTLGLGGRYSMLGVTALFTKSTDRNFDNIKKLGLSLRHEF